MRAQRHPSSHLKRYQEVKGNRQPDDLSPYFNIGALIIFAAIHVRFKGRVCAIRNKMVIDGRSYAQALIEMLLERKVNSKVLIAPRSLDVIAACSMFYGAVIDKKLSYYEEQTALRESVLGATKRPIGKDGGWGWTKVSDEIDITPLEAVTLAYWGVMTTKRRPGRKQRMKVL